MKKQLYFLLSICLMSLSPIWGQTQVFVSSGSGNDGNNGLSWESAKQTIAAGIAVAGSNGTVYVKAGNYNISSQLTLNNGVQVRGGYKMISAGTDTTKRNLPNTNSYWTNDVYCSIINGNGTHRIASVGTNCLLEGFVMNYGYTNTRGAGALIDGGTVRYCVIKDCDAINDNTFTAEGGGVYMQNGGMLTNSVITLCRGDIGPAVAGGNASLINNTITRNWPTHCGTVRDYDGNTYQSVIIGNQCWMRTNLRTTHYSDGTTIAQGGEASAVTPSYYIDYIRLPVSNFPLYGYLYNWAAVIYGNPSSNANPSGVQGICPNGWHLPSSAEWDELQNFVNSRSVYLCNGTNLNVAKALCHQLGWTSSSDCSVGSNPSSNNATRFGAVPAGYWTGSFGSYTNSAFFWSTTESGSNANARRFNYSSSVMNSSNYAKTSALSVRCLRDTAAMVPIVTLHRITSFATNGTGIYSFVRGSSPVTLHGICWSLNPHPTVSDYNVADSSAGNSFTSILQNLMVDSTYYFRAYAINSQGIAYSNEIEYHVNFCGSLTDIDGNSYQTIRIGNQCWMKENLKTTHYADGEEIAYSANYSGYSRTRSAPCYDMNKVATYGYLYNWYAATRRAADNGSASNPSGIQGVCPNGWHLPSVAEWSELYNYVMSQPQYLVNGYPQKALCDTRLWSYNSNYWSAGYDVSTNNATGFSALPAGSANGSSYWWCNTDARFATCTANSSEQYCIHFNNNGDVWVPATNTYNVSNSVRCVKD